jgi:hypothetical protein
MEGYCTGCQTKREMKDLRKVPLRGGKQAVQGECPICRAKIYRIGKFSERRIL